MILDARPMAKPSRVMAQAVRDMDTAMARVRNDLPYTGPERRKWRAMRKPEPAPEVMTWRDYVAMTLCYALAALLFVMLVDPTGFYLYVMGVLS